MIPALHAVHLLQGFKALVGTYEHMLRQLGKLLAHDDTTSDQFAQGCAIVGETRKRLTAARAQIAEAYPSIRNALYHIDI